MCRDKKCSSYIQQPLLSIVPVLQCGCCRGKIKKKKKKKKRERKKPALDLIPWFSLGAPDVQRWAGLPLLRADWTERDAVETECSAHCWGRQRRCRELDGRESKVAYLWEVKWVYLRCRLQKITRLTEVRHICLYPCAKVRQLSEFTEQIQETDGLEWTSCLVLTISLLSTSLPHIV